MDGDPADYFQLNRGPLGQVWQQLFRLRDNGLTDETWVPLICVDGRVVTFILADLRRAGVPACCVRLRLGWRILLEPSCWCLWVGGSHHRQASERLSIILPRLIRYLRQRARLSETI